MSIERHRVTVCVFFASIVLGAGPVMGGDTSPPPGPVAGTMKTLAEVEARVAVSAATTPGDASASLVISQPGSYYLVANVVADAGKDGIRIDADHVTLDLNGFVVDGTGATGASDAIAVTPGVIGLTMSNGAIANWLGGGVAAPGASELTIENVTFSDLGGAGVSAAQARCAGCAFHRCNGAFSAAGDSVLADALITSCTGTAVSVSGGCVVRRCDLRANGSFGIRVAGPGALVESCTVADTSNIGINIATGSGTVVRDCSVMGGAIGLFVSTGGNTISGNVVEGNIVNYNMVQGNSLELVVTELPLSVDWPAVVRLVGDVTGSASNNGITINADDVTIDLGGHALIGVANSLEGISASGSATNIAIRNGVVRDWGGRGIDLSGSTGAILTDLRIANNTDDGVVTNSNATVSRCVADANGVFGFILGNGCTITGCSASFNGAQGIQASPGCTVANCAAFSNGQQGIQAGNGSTVSQCSAHNNLLNGIVTSIGCTVVDCSARGNAIYGISVSDGSLVERCSVSLNGSGGIRVGEFSTIRGNQCYGNTTGPGIHVLTAGSRIEGNHCAVNLVGIDCSGTGNFITGNTSTANTTNWDVAAGNRCLVVSTTGTSGAILGDSGGTSPGSTDPNANFTY